MAVEELQRLKLENEKLLETLEVNRVVSSSLNLEVVLGTLMEKAKVLLEAEASSLMLVDDEAQELYFHTVRGEKSDAVRKIRLKMGEGIAGWVAKEGKPVLVPDCSQDPRFYKRADQLTQFVTRSMMCVPLRARKRIIGTVQVLNKTGERQFDEWDLKIFEVMADQAAVAIDNARLHEMATVDGMTGLYMKAYFLARLDDEVRRFRTQGVPVALLMSDIDHFRRVNNEYGHQAGDAALVELAQVILDTVHELGGEDMAGRYGGEEFCVLLPETGPERAMEVAEKIRKNIESRPIPIEGHDVHITISIGVSTLPEHQQFLQEAEDMVKFADEALYICKDNGRNCVALYEPRT